MKVLVVYSQRAVWGGEDAMVAASVQALRAAGCEVETWVLRNSQEIQGVGRKATLFFSGIYSEAKKSEMRLRLRKDRPDVVHAHNLYPLFTPSIISACAEEGVPIAVQAHSFFLTCPIGSHFRRGTVCRECSTHGVSRCVVNNCRGSILESLHYATRSAVANRVGWFHRADRIIVMSRFARSELIRQGYREEQVVILPNWVPLPTQSNPRMGTHVAYVGRLSPDKGIPTLLDAAARLPQIPFKIAGDGPMGEQLRGFSRAPNVQFLGWQNHDRIAALLASARLAVVPSLAYETFGLAAVEAMAHGVPPVVSDQAALAEIVDHEVSGLVFKPGDVEALRNQIERLWTDPEEAALLGSRARQQVERRFSETVYVRNLRRIYKSMVAK